MKGPRYNCESITPGLMATLASYRRRRSFDPQICADAKAYLLNEYCSRTKVSACVVGVSGGIDSAITLALVTKAAKCRGSPIKRVIAASIPAHDVEGATNQATVQLRTIIGRGVIDRGYKAVHPFRAMVVKHDRLTVRRDHCIAMRAPM